MHIEEPDRLLTKKHAKLLNIAKAAEFSSWIALGYSAIRGWIEYSTFSKYYYINSEIGFPKDLVSYLILNPIDGFNVVVNILSVIIKWVLLFLILRGLGLGLRMIVKTDINYRQKNIGEPENG